MIHYLKLLTLCFGRAIAQALSNRFSTAAARVRAQFWSCGICGIQSGTGAGFLRMLRFTMSIHIPPTVQHPCIVGVGAIGQLVADVPSGLSLTQTKETEIPKRKMLYILVLILKFQIY
jgi:hypothetical protein